MRDETADLVFRGNVIRDTRTGDARTQTVGIRLEEKVGAVTTEGNRIGAATKIQDSRKAE